MKRRQREQQVVGEEPSLRGAEDWTARIRAATLARSTCPQSCSPSSVPGRAWPVTPMPASTLPESPLFPKPRKKSRCTYRRCQPLRWGGGDAVPAALVAGAELGRHGG